MKHLTRAQTRLAAEVCCLYVLAVMFVMVIAVALTS